MKTQRHGLILAGALALALLGSAPSTHAANPAQNRYLAHIPGARVSFREVSHTAGRPPSYAYNVETATTTGFYLVDGPFASLSAATADSADKFNLTRRNPTIYGRGASAHREGVWFVEWADKTLGTCTVVAGSHWRQLSFTIYALAHACAPARGAVHATFQGVSAAIGRHSTATIPFPAQVTQLTRQTPQPAATATPAPTSQAATYNGVSVTASNLHADNGASDFDAPPAGQTYAVVRVSIVNNGDSNFDYNPYDFTLQGADDQVRYRPGALDTNISNTMLSVGTLAPGDTVAGDLAFQVPTSETRYILLWTPDFMSAAIPVPIS